jgi:hypothetical protein
MMSLYSVLEEGLVPHSKGVMVVSPTIKQWEIPSLEIVTGKTDIVKTLAPAVRGPTLSVQQ